MSSLTQATGYAIQALSCVAAAAGKPQLVREVALACDLPAPYLSKIVHKLARAGLVHTQRGVHGGVTLAQAATDIQLMDVCVALEDPVTECRCLLGISDCSDARACPAHAFNMAQRARMTEFLTTTSVADVAAFEMQRRWGNGLRHGPLNGNGPANEHADGHADGNGHAGRVSGPTVNGGRASSA